MRLRGGLYTQTSHWEPEAALTYCGPPLQWCCTLVETAPTNVATATWCTTHKPGRRCDPMNLVELGNMCIALLKLVGVISSCG